MTFRSGIQQIITLRANRLIDPQTGKLNIPKAIAFNLNIVFNAGLFLYVMHPASWGISSPLPGLSGIPGLLDSLRVALFILLIINTLDAFATVAAIRRILTNEHKVVQE
jgi:hypothetical protein